MAQRRQPGRSSDEQRQAAAAGVAIAALSFIAAEPDRLGHFLAMTGIGPESIRSAAQEPQFLAGVLDHIVADEELLLAFAAEREIDPEHVVAARDLLVGGHWERDEA
jgi:hypothetical protein